MFYSDKPINSNSEDLLNRKGFAKLLADTLVNLDSTDTFTVGLFGKWGCGKTSLVNMTLAEIQNIQASASAGKDIIVVHFEPWNFTDTSQLLTQFFVRLANEFQKKGDENLTKVGKALETYSEAFSLLEFIPAVGGPLAAVGKLIASAVGHKMQKDLDQRDVFRQKEQITKMLQDQSSRILVVIDDIDRLSNEQIRYIFQLITSVARFPNTMYLLVFDKEIVVEALKDVQSGNGQDYLEKVIQMPIQIPDIQRTDLRKVLFARLDEIRSDFKDLGYNQQHWQQLYESCVSPYIAHLRDINRLCNALRFKLTGISSEIDFADMVAISVLEIHHPSIYEWVKNNKSILTGESSPYTWRDHRAKEDWLEYYTNTLGNLLHLERADGSEEDETKRVINVLTDLFPYFGGKIGTTYEVYNLARLARNNQIAHPDKFDRYFHLDMDIIPYKTADVYNIINNLSEADITSFLFDQELKGSSYELLKDIESRLEELSGERAKTLIQAFLCSIKILNEVGHTRRLSVSIGAYAEHMMLPLIDRIPVEERVGFISELIANADLDRLQFIGDIINMIELGYGRLAAAGQERNYKKVITLEELLTVESLFTARVKEILTTHSLFDFSQWNTIYYLLNSFDPDYTKEYLDKTLVTDENILRFLDRFIISWTGSGTKYEIQKEYADWFSTDRVLSAIDACRKDGTLFRFSERLQHKCAAFFLANTGETHDNGGVYQCDTEKALASWKS